MTEPEIIAAVDQIISDMAHIDFQYEAINWADLHCVEARQYANTPTWAVCIEEADPAATSFCREIECILFNKYSIRADVNTEWREDG